MSEPLDNRAIAGKFGDGRDQIDNARIDAATFTLQSIEYEHHEIHEGNHYFIESVVDQSINHVYDLQWTTPDTTAWGHIAFIVSVESETELYIYEDAVITNAGTAVAAINNDRNSANTSGMTIKFQNNTSLANANADTDVSGATAIVNSIVGAGKDGGVLVREREIILKQNTIYCMRAISNAAGYINYLASWYEHTNKV